MPLNYVNVILDLMTGAGNPVLGGSAILVPSAQLTDTADNLLVTQAPISAVFVGSLPVVKLLATDNGALAPSGWAWTISFSTVPGNPAPWSFFLPASQMSFTATNASPAVFTVTDTAYPDGTGVQLSGGSLPAGFTAGTTYYVVNASGDTFQLASTPGGNALASTSTGSGTVAITWVYLSSLAPVSSGTAFQGYLPLPSGTPAAGQVPVATGTGEASAWSSRVAPLVIALTDGATISLDADDGNVFTVTLGGNRTLANPTNPSDGQLICLRVTQDGTGYKTLAYGSAYVFGSLAAPVLSAAAGAVDLLFFQYSAAAGKWTLVLFAPGAAPVWFTGSGQTPSGHWYGSLVTDDITVLPNAGISSSASMFMDNNAGQVWEFFNNSSGQLAIYDKIGNSQVFTITPDGQMELSPVGDVNLSPGGGLRCYSWANFLAGMQLQRVQKSASYGISSSQDYIVGVDTSGGAYTMTLPDVTYSGQTYIIKDETGHAATNHITVATSSGQTIDGAASATISTNYGVLRVYSNGGNWSVW
ncbi:MAG: hypothetical protein ACRDP5_28310 [Streptosporangiaceae bacterium]